MFLFVCFLRVGEMEDNLSEAEKQGKEHEEKRREKK